MRKICTVLLLNFLRSTNRPKLAFRSCIIALAIIAAGVFATSFFNQPSDVIKGEHASAVISDSSSPNASGASQAENQPAGTAKPQNSDKKDSTKSSNKTNNSTQSNGGGSASNSGGASTELILKGVALDPTTAVCDGQQPAYAIQTARVSTSTSIHGSGTIRWYWETHVDGAESTDAPPISPQIYAQSVSTGTAPVTLQSANNSDPLIKAPTSSNYSYSFRLHILGPNEIVSDWVSVPVVLDNSCATTPS